MRVTGKPDKSGTDRFQRGCHVRFVFSIVVAFGGFVLIWGPWPWLMFAGAFTSFAGTFNMGREAWRLASSRRASMRTN